jgi:hypothetical protein
MKSVTIPRLLVLLLVLILPDWSFSQSVSPTVVRYADSVVAFSSQWSSTSWSARQALGPPDTYPNYGDISTAWASLTPDGQREYLVLWYANAAPIRYVAIYETWNPGAVDTIYVKNPGNGQWVVVWSGSAQPAGDSSRIFQVSFPLTSFNVSEVRIAINSPAVTGWNEVDAVAISDVPVTSAPTDAELPVYSFSLEQNYPNPFNPRTVIRFAVPSSKFVTLKVFNIVGQEVAALVNEETKPGRYEVTWDASAFPSGVYFYRLTAGSFVETKKLILLR